MWLCGRFGENEPRAETDATAPEQGRAHPMPAPIPGKMQGGSLRSADSDWEEASQEQWHAAEKTKERAQWKADAFPSHPFLSSVQERGEG
jgi:hypothetical protein